MRALGIIAATALACSPCLAQTPALTPLHTAHLACLAQAASQLDDATSPASSVAIGIEPMCQAEWDALMEAYTADMRPASARAFMARLAPTRTRDATAAVLRYRASSH